MELIVIENENREEIVFLDYVDYLKSHNIILSLYGESARTAKFINTMLSMIRSFYQLYEVSYGAVNPTIVEEVFRGDSYILAHINHKYPLKNLFQYGISPSILI